jgi:AAA15 family ATPase/GTPase
MMIDGFSIAGYRSFGPDEVKIEDLSRVNVFIGKNNCGKSNILRFLSLIGEGFDSGTLGTSIATPNCRRSYFVI